MAKAGIGFEKEMYFLHVKRLFYFVQIDFYYIYFILYLLYLRNHASDVYVKGLNCHMLQFCVKS